MTTDELKGLVLAILRRHGPLTLERVNALVWFQLGGKEPAWLPVSQTMNALVAAGPVTVNLHDNDIWQDTYALAAPTPPSTPDALFAQVLINPGDEATRLVYADCLEDHGMPETAAWWRKAEVHKEEWKGREWVVVEEPYPVEWATRTELEIATNNRVYKGGLK